MWEGLNDVDLGEVTTLLSHRLKIPGGWLVRTVMLRHGDSSMIQTFVNDPDHTWRLK